MSYFRSVVMPLNTPRYGVTIPDRIDGWTDSIEFVGGHWLGAGLDNVLLPVAGNYGINCPGGFDMWMEFSPLLDVSVATRLNFNAAMPVGATGNLYITLIDKEWRQVRRAVYVPPAKIYTEIDIAVPDIRVEDPLVSGNFDYSSVIWIFLSSEGPPTNFWIDQFYFYSLATSTLFIFIPKGPAIAQVKMEQGSYVETITIPKTFSHDPSTAISLTALEPSGYTFKKWVINQQEYLNKQIGPLDFVAGSKNYIDVYYSGGGDGRNNLLLALGGGVLGMAILYYLFQHK